MLSAITRAVAIIWLLSSASVSAQVVITQERALAGNVTPGDEPGFPIRITRQGSYKLGSNIVVNVANKIGFLVSVPNVTIDLNGFALTGSGLERVVGVTDGKNAAGHVTVRNGTITRFQSAITTFGDYWVIEGVKLINNYGAIHPSFRVHVSNSLVAGNKGWGIYAGGGSFIERSIIANNAFGIRFYGGGLALGNTIYQNRSYGLYSEPSLPPSGFGNNMLSLNNGGGNQIDGNLLPLQPNACTPACP